MTPAPSSPTHDAACSVPESAHFADQQERRQRRQYIEQLEDQITELAAHIDAATCRWLELVREYDACEGWGAGGLISCAHWLNWKCGMGLGAAREKVRVAHALKELPLISQAFRLGQVSYSKVRAMTRVATPQNEGYLMMIARHGTAVHVERLVRQYRQVKRGEALALENARHAQRELAWSVDDEGFWVLRGRFTAEQGALIQNTLERAMEEQYQEQSGVPAGTSRNEWGEEVDPAPEPVALRRADALVRVAEAYGAVEGKAVNGGDRFLVHVHADREALEAALETALETGTPQPSANPQPLQDSLLQPHQPHGAEAAIEGFGSIAAETARRLACDAGLVHWLERADGSTLDVGRKTRSVPPAIRRALQRRDGGCRFPGCTCSRFVDAHHIRHWADGGETSLANLVLLCRRHHRLVHEGGFGIRTAAHGAIDFTDPAGAVIPPGPDTRSRGNVLSLFTTHSQSGINITAKTAHSLWLGEPMDDELAVLGMLQLE